MKGSLSLEFDLGFVVTISGVETFEFVYCVKTCICLALLLALVRTTNW